MSRLDEIERRINERMAEIDRKINGIVGGDTPPSDGRRGFDGVPVAADRSCGGRKFSMAPLNPEFIDWIHGASRGYDPSFGLAPAPFDFSYLAHLPQTTRNARPAGTYPRRYDLREVTGMMPVRDQNPYGTCWAHAALASMESCLKKRNEVFDFSENNLVNLSGFDSGYFNPHQPGKLYGGNDIRAMAYLLRWDGPVLESQDPYGRPGASRAFPPACHLQSVKMIPQMRDASDVDGVKEAVMTHGAVSMSYVHDHAALNDRTGAYYNPTKNGGGHAVTIVGWDDDYATSNFNEPPPGPGAWIVRNSWGTEWGDGGYYYVSYHDATFGRRSPGCSYYGIEGTDNYDDILQYDRLGLVTSLGDNATEKAVAANVFAPGREVVVEAVGFYALVPGTSYRVRVCAGCQAENPESGREGGATSGVADFGYVTVRLSEPVRVASGERFSVIVELNTPGLYRPLAVECAIPEAGSSKAEAAPGQSFVFDPGQGWVDMTALHPTLNFCCKAYVKFPQAESAARREASVPHTKVGVEDFGLVAKNSFYLATLRPGEELPPSNSSAFFQELARFVAQEAAKRDFSLGFSNIFVIKDGSLTQKSTRMFCTRNPSFTGIPKDPCDDGERLLRYAAEVATYYAKRWNSVHVVSACVSWSWKDARIDMINGKRTFQFLEPHNAFYTPASKDFTRSLLVFDGENVLRDSVGHEYTHGVSLNRRRWAMYAFVTGAVNESFSDIFAKFATWAWEGFDPRDPNRWTYSACRDMAHPENIPQNGWTVASYYLQKPKPGNPKSGWYRGRGDNGGVHLNNGVLSRLCFLLCEGERFTRDDGRSFDVSPIGFDRTEELFGALLFGAYLNEEIRTLYEVCGAIAKAAQDLQFSDAEWQGLTAACDAVAIIPPEAYANMRGINRECKMKKVEKKLWQRSPSLPENLAATFRSELSLDVPDAGYDVVEITENDAGVARGAAGERRVVLQQTCRGIHVFGATAVTHVRDDGTVTYFSNRFSNAIARVSGDYRIGKEGASAAALDGREDIEVSTVEKVVWDPAAAGEAGTPVFAWRVVTASGEIPEEQVIVDAGTGQVLFSAPLRTM